MATDPHHQQQPQQQQQEQYTSYDWNSPEVAPQHHQHQEYYGGEHHQPHQYAETTKYAPQVQPYQEVAYDSLPQVAHDNSNYPQVAYDKTLPEALPPHAYQQHSPQPPYDSQQYNYYQQSPAADAPQVYEGEKKTLGLRKRTLLIVLGLIIALVVIAAVLGGVLGTQLGKDKKSKDEDIPTTTASSTPTSSPTPTATPIILDTSKLSAVNWTDSDNTDYQAVFWQDNQTNLIMSLSDSGGKTWETTNISDIMSSSFSAKAGTHLSAAVRGYPWTSSPWNKEFGIALYYIAESGVIEEVYSTDIRGASWKRGTLTTSSANLQAADGSSLAAWWSECEVNCTDITWLFYEDPDGSLMYAGDDDWAAPQFLVRNIVNSAGIAATAIPFNSSASPAANSPRVYYHDSNVLQELMYTFDPEPTWYYGKKTALFSRSREVGTLTNKQQVPSSKTYQQIHRRLLQSIMKTQLILESEGCGFSL
ncbi:hypothetical protein UCRPA7_3750 [Phaeoacremonium minimum UCRPA7]|uniref:Fucose-specific lectin n=1 Tax=Phaeoacremonium minimum (strain UCR-PA7) TaxID=1286976 RepID=R8BN52_PHAM7|nr:hypothetical protein UCRPA7_3750 [Phaeoacremonium minimum UCRPA7]EOO00720.1 hypothetical protein UCRPA7_3750 [Phaeoacremonium minimum UCRPA7]